MSQAFQEIFSDMNELLFGPERRPFFLALGLVRGAVGCSCLIPGCLRPVPLSKCIVVITAILGGFGFGPGTGCY